MFSRDGEHGCLISVLDLAVFLHRPSNFNLAEDSFAKYILSEQCKNICYSFSGTHYSVKKSSLFLFFSFYLVVAVSESSVEGNPKDELSVWVSLFCAITPSEVLVLSHI